MDATPSRAARPPPPAQQQAPPPQDQRQHPHLAQPQQPQLEAEATPPAPYCLEGFTQQRAKLSNGPT
jgi:hypothetical protein